ncbi:PQQ-binding-like beta-propeller repeat protein [Janibacter cremeus]|uniref:outer membrane protein assembly factor BamB family protein n=1 Tax=Janibacter cremeus TaxID=1285192 RepID=UPI0023FA393A|nr:PQQ-binding-like beta-propeller repeat protein [Janibacter cremeus]WEV77548.1 PQQ-binding-like beta-propeller repeat protein [Janibacter cremeus]
MTHTRRIRAVGAALAVGVLAGCSLVGDDPAPEGEPPEQASDRVTAFRETGRPVTHDLLATMGRAPTQLFTLPVAATDPREECSEATCVVTWRPIDADTVVAEGTVSGSREGRHDFRSAVDLTTGEVAWSTSESVPAGQVDAGEICVGGSADALVCVETGTSGPDQYAFRTISADNGGQVARAPFAEVAPYAGAPTPQDSTIVGMSAERRGDEVYVSVLVQEDEAATRTASVHAARIGADGSIVWHNQSPASIGDGILSETHLLGDELVLTHVTTEAGEPFALSAETGDLVVMSSDNADALTGITESARRFVDDGSATDHRFLYDGSRNTQVVPAGDVDEDPLWSIPSDVGLGAVCGGVVALTDDPYDDVTGHAVSVRALEDGRELWRRPLPDEAAISCDGDHLLVADDDGLTALAPETGERAWSVDGPWDQARAITALDPTGASERFAVIGSDAAGEETVTVYQAR